jgi:hypothetical protein
MVGHFSTFINFELCAVLSEGVYRIPKSRHPDGMTLSRNISSQIPAFHSNTVERLTFYMLTCYSKNVVTA